MEFPFIKKQDAEIAKMLRGEEKRQAEGLELIPSENYVSRAVKEVMASSLTNKYSEGYPGRRYYGGQEFTDQVEMLAIERAKKLFGAKYANVQPLGGANANIAMYFALLQPGDTILGMDLSHGGHLTHGHPVTYLTKIFDFQRYKMKDIETGEIDYADMRRVAKKIKPKIVLAGFSAYPRELDYKKFVAIAREVGAVSVMDIAHIAGLIAGKAAKNPFDYGFDIMTTTTHKTLRGPRGGLIMCKEPHAKVIDSRIFPGTQGGPLMHCIAAKAVAFAEALRPDFKTYQQQILKNAKALAEGLVSKGNRLVSGGTDNHLMLLDLRPAYPDVTGQQAEDWLVAANIVVNKNMIPFDERKPTQTSGLRIGTPAVTTRGMKEPQMTLIASLIDRVLRARGETPTLEAVRGEVRSVCEQFPL